MTPLTKILRTFLHERFVFRAALQTLAAAAAATSPILCSHDSSVPISAYS